MTDFALKKANKLNEELKELNAAREYVADMRNPLHDYGAKAFAQYRLTVLEEIDNEIITKTHEFDSL